MKAISQKLIGVAQINILKISNISIPGKLEITGMEIMYPPIRN